MLDQLAVGVVEIIVRHLESLWDVVTGISHVKGPGTVVTLGNKVDGSRVGPKSYHSRPLRRSRGEQEIGLRHGPPTQ